MDPDCFTMSQYQFVNSLASCYPQTGNTNNNSTTAANQATPTSDYFPANTTYNPNLYPNTPQAHYANQAYNIGGNGSGQANPGGPQPNPTDMVDYTQLQPQRLLLQNQQPQSQPQNQQQNPQQAQASCKYANDPTTTPTGNNNQSISSPQDLSTRDISPKLSPSSVVENVARSLNKTVGVGVGGSSSVTSTSLTSSLSNNHNTSIPIPMHSPTGDTDSESDSGNEAGSSQNSGNGKKGNPPQIYPWMKRVHIGQSKYIFSPTYLYIYINLVQIFMNITHSLFCKQPRGNNIHWMDR